MTTHDVIVVDEKSKIEKQKASISEKLRNSQDNIIIL